MNYDLTVYFDNGGHMDISAYDYSSRYARNLEGIKETVKYYRDRCISHSLRIHRRPYSTSMDIRLWVD